VSKKKSDISCHCGSGHAFIDCCEPYIRGMKFAPTAEALMRSRFTAYAIKHEQYLLDTWHASTRPESIDLDPMTKWIRLDILENNNNSVEFVATCRIQGKAHKLYEKSRFVFEDGKWFYLDGDSW